MTTQANYKVLLETQLKELIELEETSRASAGTVELDQSKVGRLSRMDAMQQQAMSVELLRRQKQQLLRVQAALKRIADDEYGWCLDCGEEINPQRLAIDPAATYCVQCADKHN